MHHKLAQLQREETGQSLVMVALFMVVLIGLLGLVIDMGYGYSRYRQMQLSADAAALAGARELALGKTQQETLDRMAQLLCSNDADVSALCAGSGVASSSYAVVGGTTTVATARSAFPTFFVALFGMDDVTVAASSQASYGRLSSSGNLMPIAVPEDKWVVGTEDIMLWDEDKPVAPGNTGWIDWGTGNLQFSIAYPELSPEVSVGDAVDAEPGVTTSALHEMEAWIGQQITVLLYNGTNGQNGNNLDYYVSGFARFIVTKVETNGKDKNKPKKYIEGTFIDYVSLGGPLNPGGTKGIVVVGLLQ